MVGGGRPRHRPHGPGDGGHARLRRRLAGKPAGDGGAGVQNKTPPNFVALLKEWNLQAGKRRGGGRLAEDAGADRPETPLGVRVSYARHHAGPARAGDRVPHRAQHEAAGTGTRRRRDSRSTLVETARRPRGPRADFSGELARARRGQGRPRPRLAGRGRDGDDRDAPAVPRGPRPPPRRRREAPPRARRAASSRTATRTSRATRLFGIQGNRDLFLNTVAWLRRGPGPHHDPRQDPDDQRLFHDPAPAGRGVRGRHPGLARAVRGAGRRKSSWWIQHRS